MKYILYIYVLITLFNGFFSSSVRAWGPEAHRMIGQAAYRMADPAARAGIGAILDIEAGKVEVALAEACFWPDEAREQPQWEWTAPMHYVNIPRHADHYDRQRDCRDGRCVTEAIVRFAGDLDSPGSDAARRWQALAFVCHFVADLHQPLHAGFLDDRGGNTVNIVYRGTESNLHYFWDSLLISERVADEGALVEMLAGQEVPRSWQPAEVIAWTEESHALAQRSAYPESTIITQAFADRSWNTVTEQWRRAAVRLAQVLNATLGAGEVVPETP
jgi:hypothetical protein